MSSQSSHNSSLTPGLAWCGVRNLIQLLRHILFTITKLQDFSFTSNFNVSVCPRQREISPSAASLSSPRTWTWTARSCLSSSVSPVSPPTSLARIPSVSPPGRLPSLSSPQPPLALSGLSYGIFAHPRSCRTRVASDDRHVSGISAPPHYAASSSSGPPVTPTCLCLSWPCSLGVSPQISGRLNSSSCPSSFGVPPRCRSSPSRCCHCRSCCCLSCSVDLRLRETQNYTPVITGTETDPHLPLVMGATTATGFGAFFR